jgi:hypothetical protein
LCPVCRTESCSNAYIQDRHVEVRGVPVLQSAL